MPGQVRMVTRKTKGEPGLEATEVGAGAGGLKGTQPDLGLATRQVSATVDAAILRR
jgi:hypothetical protein